MGNGNRSFEPTAGQADDVLIQLVYADSTVDEVATSKGITVDQLTEWLARPEIVALKERIEAAATSHTRYSAIVNSPRQVRLLVDSCFEIHSEIHDAAQGRRPPRSSTQILKTVDKVLQICREMQYLTGFTPGDTPPPRRMPKADRRPRTTDTAPNRGTDTALSVRGGPPPTSATKFDTTSHERETPSTVVQALQAHNRTTAPVQQQQQPEPQFVSPSIAAAAPSLQPPALTSPQPPAATSPPAPISNCLPACETGERWLPDAQRLVPAPSDSPPTQWTGEQWAGEPPPAPTASSPKESLASPHTPYTTPAEAARRKREADFRAAYDDVYEGDEPDFDDAAAPPPRVPPPAPPPPRPASLNHQPQSIAPRVDKVRHYNTVEPFS